MLKRCFDRIITYLLRWVFIGTPVNKFIGTPVNKSWQVFSDIWRELQWKQNKMELLTLYWHIVKQFHHNLYFDGSDWLTTRLLPCIHLQDFTQWVIGGWLTCMMHTTPGSVTNLKPPEPMQLHSPGSPLRPSQGFWLCFRSYVDWRLENLT